MWRMSLSNVDHVNREALVAVEGKYIVAVARYDRVTDDAAEVAIVVGDPWQGHGVGSMLMERLAKRAAANGITHFVADTFGDNRQVQGMVRRTAPRRKASFDGGLLHYDIDITGAA